MTPTTTRCMASAGDRVASIVGRLARGGRRADSQPTRMVNPSHYVDYQDCKYAGRHRMLCTGVAEMRQSPDAPPFRLGGLELVDLVQGRPLHQVPVPLWTPSGVDMTHNPVWIEASDAGLRGLLHARGRSIDALCF